MATLIAVQRIRDDLPAFARYHVNWECCYSYKALYQSLTFGPGNRYGKQLTDDLNLDLRKLFIRKE